MTKYNACPRLYFSLSSVSLSTALRLLFLRSSTLCWDAVDEAELLCLRRKSGPGLAPFLTEGCSRRGEVGKEP